MSESRTDGDEVQQSGGTPGDRTRFPLGLVILVAVGLVSGLLMAVLILFNPLEASQTAGGGAPTPVPAAVREGELAPDFTAQTATGETVSLAEMRGRPVLINFWATWCGPCRVEMPALQSATERHADEGLTVLAVNAMEPADQVQDYMNELELTFPAVLDPDGDIIDLYGVRVFPTTVVVGSDGRVLAQHFGALTDELIDEYVELALAGSEG